VAVVAALGSCAGAAHGVSTAGGFESAAFADTQRDGGGGLDFAQMSAFPSASAIDFVFHFLGLGTTSPANGVATLWLDADSRSGDSDGFDHKLEYDYARKTLAFARWNGSAWTDAAGGSWDRLGGNVMLTVRKSELKGVSDDIRFAVTAGPDASHSSDRMPDSGTWGESFAPFRLTIEKLKVEPVRGGGKLVVTARALRSDTGQLVGRDTGLSCSATVAGGTLKLAQSAMLGGLFEGSDPNARCAWTVPKRLKGKTIRGILGVVFGSGVVTQRFSARVK
jgi:hypothetical protein